MNLRRLEYFVGVAEAAHFRRAAEALHVAQPALSVQVARLEAELGVILFDRNRRGVTLTPAGATLLARARVLLPALRDALAETTAVGDGRAGVVRVGFVGSAAYQLLPQALRRAEREFPAARIVLRQMVSQPQAAALQTGELDLALVRAPSDLPGVTGIRIIAEPFVVALPTAHPLAVLRRVAAARLHAQPFVTLPVDSGPLRDAMIAELALAGASPAVVDEVTDMPALLGLVAAGRGVALVPRSVAGLRLPGLTFRPLVAPRCKAELWLLRRRDDARPLVDGLFDLLRQQAG
jgi:DNA-binding transcriptional LysR family regulator